MTSESRDLTYVLICSACKEEYIGEIGKGKSGVRVKVRVY